MGSWHSVLPQNLLLGLPSALLCSPFVCKGLGALDGALRMLSPLFKKFTVGEDKFTSKETTSRGLGNVNIFGKSCVKLLILKQILNIALSINTQDNVAV